MESDTTALRTAAAHWSLAGDSQLLSVLQSLHQTIITKCQETNSQLDAMVSALDNASIDLQNVNNKFMALSNSQFVESRVYEDEVELAENNPKQESSKPEAQNSLSSLKLGLQVLESLHEVVAIVDSDSEDEEHSPRRVLRPRPHGRIRLPHVVGTPAWREAAHAGLLSDADSEDSTDKRASAPEEYSDSDTASSSSLSSMTSHVPPPPVTSRTPPRHDAHTEEQIPEPELEESPQPRKLYTVERHIPAQIFPDEPPPLDKFEAESDDDIFAELHKQPYPDSNEGHNVVDDLFGSGPYLKGNDFGNIVRDTVVRENSPLFSNSLEPESKETPPHEIHTETGLKKPVGGISLFGSKGSETIEAAILKRNQRQSSSEIKVTETQTSKSNIIDDLFIKPAKNVKKEPSYAKNEPVVKEVVADKILFSDNIFDDVDDIFTSNVNTKTKNIEKNSLFDDDLFKADKDDNNDLFNDNNHSNKNIKKVKSIFDSDSEDDLFSDVKLKDNSLQTNREKHIDDKSLVKINVTTHTHQFGGDKTSDFEENKAEIQDVQVKHQRSPNIFDDDDVDDLFVDKSHSKSNSPSKTEISRHINDEIQHSKNEQDFNIKSERTIINEAKTEAKTKILDLENQRTYEKDESNVNTIDINISNDDEHINILINNSELDKNLDIKKPSAVIKNKEPEIMSVISEPEVPSLAEIDFLEESKTLKEKDIVKDVSEQHNSEDMFVDIFDDLPPAFEKPVEPKRSKNVNALFDDDSDDEALFFKKDEVITDEKPDLEFKSDRFQIFHDEPPDINTDFSQKTKNTNQIPVDLDLPDQKIVVNVEHNSLQKVANLTEKEILNENVRSEKKHNTDNVNNKSATTNEQTRKTDILKLLASEKDEDIFKENKDKEEVIFSDPEEINSKEEISKSGIEVGTNKDITDSSENEKKSVGRLGPVTININVSSLLPGVVPRKSKSNEEIDGQTASKSNEDFTEPQTSKTVNFKSNPDSKVLDNKLSKERAKIQVKRRPSTRRARLEAVRKSGLDFGSDSTDNSSSFDEPIKETHKSNKMSVPYEKLKNESKLNSEENETNSEVKDVTSKVVYILHDEDIFEVPARTETLDTNTGDDLFNPISTTEDHDKEALFHPIKENTTSFVDEVSEKKVEKVDIITKMSLFDDMSDDDTELFKKPLQKSVFDSDSDSELFSGKKDKGKRESGSKVEQKRIKETKVQQKVQERKVEKKVTKSLFSDDSDEELFGSKTKKPDFKETSKPKQSATKTSRTFEDPLSMLGNDET